MKTAEAGSIGQLYDHQNPEWRGAHRLTEFETRRAGVTMGGGRTGHCA